MGKKNTEAATILVVLGATGDLVKKKIIPSVCHLHTNGRLSERFRAVGVARRGLSDIDFQSSVRAGLKERLPNTEKKTVDEVSSLFTYHQGEFGDPDAFRRLKTRLEKIDNEWGVCANKLFYLAVPPDHFGTIFKNMSAAGLHIPCGGKAGWTRLLIEKPFGISGVSAEKLFSLTGKYFKEEQLYFIDHYLAKEIVQGITHFRFSNNLLEKSWDKNSIERIDIRLLETIGTEERGAFYDTVGAFRDVGENHLLQMLAAITMDPPRTLSADELRRRRAEIIETLKKWSTPEIKESTFRAQYDGYRSIEGVSPGSGTETYFKLRTELTHPSWSGVPITLEAGKRCPKAVKEIVVTFKHPPLCAGCTGGDHIHNRVVFRLAPEDRISIHFWINKPGFENDLEERTFDFFLYEHTEDAPYVEEYAELLFNCLIGDQTMFVSEREILAQWRFADPVLSAWRNGAIPLDRYTPETDEMVHASMSIGQNTGLGEIPREIGLVGLGKMGAGIARRLMDHGWRVVGYNLSPEATQKLAREGLVPARDLQEAVRLLPVRKIVWLMVPAGKPVDEVLFGKEGLVKHLKKGDMVIDGGNSFYKDTVKRAKKLSKHGIHFLDCGTSGGPGGARHGACLMIGGRRKDFEALEALFRDLAVPDGCQFFEGAGAGHFVKMIHNGIEYGMMQAIAEGFAILKKAKFDLDLTRVADVFNHGSVIESRLVGWLKEAFELYGEDLKPISGKVQQSGEGAWTVQTAHEMGIEDKVIHEALLFRNRSGKKPNFTGQVVSALRGQFGGHPVLKKDPLNL
jgi:glucose-6-phosphate 1-dehydrogenase/6-phosphogluconate dehydrogenase (decarboxylating)